MACKKCDCEIRLHVQDIKHKAEMSEMVNQFVRLRRDMAYFQYTLTGDTKYLQKLEFELKNGGF